MNRYKLFSEFRNHELFGETLKDALQRHPKLQRTDRYAAGKKSEEGEKIEIAKIIGEVKNPNFRGTDNIVACLVELTDGRIEQIDALPLPVLLVSE